MNMSVNSNTPASTASAISSTESAAPDTRVGTLDKVESMTALLSRIRQLMAKADEETRKDYFAREYIAIDGQYTAAELAFNHHKTSIAKGYEAATSEFIGGVISAGFGFAGSAARLSPSAGYKTDILGSVGSSAGNGIQSGFKWRAAGESTEAETSKLAADTSQAAVNQYQSAVDRARQDRDAVRQQSLELERAVTDLIIEHRRAVREA